MIKKYCIVLVSLLLLIMAMPLQAFAMESVTAEIPFFVANISGTVVIESIDDAPLPEVTEFENVSNGTFEICYTEPNDYYYKLYQIPGSQYEVIYDEKVYSVIVSIFVDENGELYPVITVSIDGSDHKPDKIVFMNSVYNNPPTPPDDTPADPPKDPPEKQPDQPSGYEPFDPGGSPIGGEDEELPENLPEGSQDSTPDETPDVVPESTPDDIDGNEKDPGLPQTGQIWWPVPIMLGIGILLFGAGIFLRRKDRENN